MATMLSAVGDSKVREPETLLRAVMVGDVRAAERFIAGGANPRDIHPTYKQSLLFFAAAYASFVPLGGPGGRTAMLRFLLEDIGLEAGMVDSNGQTALFYAAKDGLAEACQYLIERRCDPGHADSIFKQTPLFYAAKNCRSDCVTLLLDEMCHVDTADKNGRTALFFAGSAGVVSALVEGGANLNYVDSKGLTAAMLHSHTGQAEQLAALIDVRADLSLASKDRKTCWHYALHHKGHEVYQALERLIPSEFKAQQLLPASRPPEPAPALGPRVKAVVAEPSRRAPVTRRATAAAAAPPKEAAAEQPASSSSAPGPASAVAASGVVEHSARRSPRLAEARGGQAGSTRPAARGVSQAASRAAPGARTRLARQAGLTVAGQDPSSSSFILRVDQSAVSPARKSRCWVVSEHGKLDLGASLNKAIRSEGTAKDVEEIVKATVQEFGWNPDDILRNAGGWSWIHYAACREDGALDICKILHSYGVDPTKVDELGQTPLFYSVRRSTPKTPSSGFECARWLLEVKCDPNHVDANGDRPLDYASKNDDARCAQELLARGAATDLVASSGFTVLSNAVGFGFVETARVLLESRCDPSARMEPHMGATAGATAIFLACNEAVLDLLLVHRASVNERDDLGRTPLVIAAWNCALPSVKALVSRSADINAADNHGDTCLTLAAPNKNCVPVCKFLIEECSMDPDTCTRMGPTVGELLAMAEARDFELARERAAKRLRHGEAGASPAEEASPQDEDMPQVLSSPPVPSAPAPAPAAVAPTAKLVGAGATGSAPVPTVFGGVTAGRSTTSGEGPATGELTRCTIGFKGDDGNLMPIGSPEYHRALQELVELCPELQDWSTKEVVPEAPAESENGRWLDVCLLDESDAEDGS